MYSIYINFNFPKKKLIINLLAIYPKISKNKGSPGICQLHKIIAKEMKALKRKEINHKIRIKNNKKQK